MESICLGLSSRRERAGYSGPNRLGRCRGSESLSSDLSFFVLLSRIRRIPSAQRLAGVDRPDLVDVLTREIYDWAGLTPAE